MEAFDIFFFNNSIAKALAFKVLIKLINVYFSVVVTEFESALLECTATGSPPPRIEWRRADNAVLPTGENN